MKNNLSNLLLAGAMTLGLAVPAMAVNPYYAAGDLVLTFQKAGDTNTVYVGLGNAATLYRGSAAGPGAANNINFLDLDTKLIEAFGADWATDPDIFAGLAGVYSTSDTSTVVVNGDAARTVYVSATRYSVGTVGASNSSQWIIFGDTDLSNGASDINTQNNVFGDIGTFPANNYAEQIVVSPTSISKIDNLQPLTIFQGVASQGVAFRAFEGGVQQQGSATAFGNFGAAGSVEFALDLYRIVAVEGLANEVAGTGTTGEGTYEGTITVGTNGKVSFISQGAAPTSTYDTWASTFNPPLTNANDRLPTADPDNDGFNNLAEFVLNGNPSVSNQSIAPALDASGANFVFSFTRRDDSVTQAPATFQYGSDLSGWTDVPVATSGTVGAATVVVAPGTAVTDGVTVTVPKSVAVGGKLFGRIKIVK